MGKNKKRGGKIFTVGEYTITDYYKTLSNTQLRKHIKIIKGLLELRQNDTLDIR